MTRDQPAERTGNYRISSVGGRNYGGCILKHSHQGAASKQTSDGISSFAPSCLNNAKGRAGMWFIDIARRL
jgi:hypothetical protein